MDDEGSLPPPPDRGQTPQAPTPERGLSQGPLPPATAPADGDRVVGILTLAGGLLVVIGWFLPALTVRGPYGMHVDIGTKAGWGLVVLGAFAVAKGAAILWPQTVRLRLSTPLLTGGLLVVLLLFRWNDIQNAVRQIEADPGLTAGPGVGFWLEVLGTVLVLAAGILALRAKRRT